MNTVSHTFSFLMYVAHSYLPEVAADQGWDQGATIESLLRKAGYHGRITPALLQKLQCTRYQSSKTRVTFDEYLQVRGDSLQQVLALTSSSGVTGDANESSSRFGSQHSRRDGHNHGRDSTCIIS